MVMIPSDVGLQVRGQVEPALQPVRAVAEIPGDLPELQPGQVFSARIQEVLPENTYKALVAGHALTLALPEGAKAGDTLELVMIERTPRAILARLANGATATAGATTDASASLSRTGQLIAALLARDGEAAPRLALSASRPLLPAAPAATNQLAAELATELPAALARAVTTSGLFYESHQVQWVLGERPLATLLLEPQGRHASLAAEKQMTAPMAMQVDATDAEKSALAGRRAAGDSGVSALSLLRTLFGGAAPTAEGASSHAAQSAHTSAVLASSGIPDDLRPLVQQQLDAAATQRLVWHGEVWPRQTMDWEIAHDEASASATDDAGNWHTTVHLTLPRLGELSARLAVSGQQVSLTVHIADAGGAADLRTHAPRLQTAFAAAGLNLQRLDVRHGG